MVNKKTIFKLTSSYMLQKVALRQSWAPCTSAEADLFALRS
jgi:hypothetical protein